MLLSSADPEARLDAERAMRETRRHSYLSSPTIRMQRGRLTETGDDEKSSSYVAADRARGSSQQLNGGLHLS